MKPQNEQTDAKIRIRKFVKLTRHLMPDLAFIITRASHADRKLVRKLLGDDVQRLLIRCKGRGLGPVMANHKAGGLVSGALQTARH